MDHKIADIALQANDLVSEPNDIKRQIGLAAAHGFGSAAVLALGYSVID